MRKWWRRKGAGLAALAWSGRPHVMEGQSTSRSGVSGGERATPTTASVTVVDPGPEIVHVWDLKEAEEVWRALKATQREGEDHPRVEDMVREVERMTGVAAVDVAVAQLLDMAQHLTRSPSLKLERDLFRIAQLVRPPQPPWVDDPLTWRDLASRSRSDFEPIWIIVGVLCVHMTLALTARCPATPWVAHAVTMGAPLNESSVRALVTALIALLARDGDGSLCYWWWGRLYRNLATEKEVEVFHAALNLNRITSLELPVLFKREGPGEPWGLDCGHVLRMLSVNATLKSLALGETCLTGHDGSDGAVAVFRGGVVFDAYSAAPKSPQLLSTLAASWTNATLHNFLFTCEETAHDRLVQMDEAFEMIAHLHALQTLNIRQGLAYEIYPRSPTHSTTDASSFCVAWSENCLGLLKHILTSTTTLTQLSFLLQAPSAVVDCVSHNRGTLKNLELSLDVYGRRAMFKLLTPGPPGATTAHAITNSLEHLNLYDMCPRRHSSIVECKSCELRRSGNVERVGKEVEEEVNALAAMIANNTSLLGLLLYDAKYSPRQWATIIFPALAHNNTLKDLEVIECAGVDADHGVSEAMLSMLQRNTTLRRIMLQGTPLQAQGQGAAIQAQLQRNREYRAALAGLPSMSVKS